MQECAIDRGVEVRPQVRNARYPFHKMAVGESFYSDSRKAVSAAWHHGKKYKKMFVTRTEGDGVRVWRLA